MSEIIRRAFMHADEALTASALERAKAENAAHALEGAQSAEMRASAERVAYHERVVSEQSAMVEAVGAQLAKVAEGDLTARVEAALDGSYGKLKADLNAVMACARARATSTKPRRNSHNARSSRPPAWKRRPPRSSR
jgi:hypothetical protein